MSVVDEMPVKCTVSVIRNKWAGLITISLFHSTGRINLATDAITILINAKNFRVMLPDRHLNSRRYYDLLPPSTHSCGDIWQGLPSFGLLGSAPIRGLIVTPACDLSQRKVETITYLPIISVRTYFSTLATLPDTRRRIQDYLQSGQLSLELPWAADSFVPPKLHQLETTVQAIEGHLKAKQRGTVEIAALNRAITGLRIAGAIAKPELSQISAEDLTSFFGSDWPKMKERIVTNSFNSHLHFIPSDGQDPVYSGIPEHSVVLFR
jgi:hypothetical protein